MYGMPNAPADDNGLLKDGSVCVRDENRLIKGRIYIAEDNDNFVISSYLGGGIRFLPNGRMSSEGEFIIGDDGYKRELNINPHDTFEFSRSLIDLSNAQKLFAIINLKTHEEYIAFKLDNFKNPEKIKEFFSNHQDMLPEPIKEKIFPKLSLNPSPSEETGEGQSFLIIALIVIIVGTAIVSTKYFSSRVAK